jgi:hypothetical protein
MSIYTNTTIPPTVLYIKQHSVTGLKYFGKTTKKDPVKYNGSGTDWILHLKEYGSDHIITTIVFGPCTDPIAVSKFAIDFSIKNNIVKSDEYANCKIENGLDGAPPGPNGRKGIPSPLKGKPSGRKGKPTGPHSAESNQKKSERMKGKPTGKKGIPNGRKGIPSPLKGKPSGRKGIPTKKKGNPSGKQQNPASEVECPHCGLVGRGGAMKRHHFDNCKFKTA